MRPLDEIRDLAEAVVARRSLRLWDVEMSGRHGGTVVRVFVDSEQGVDLDTVAAVSEEISRGLDLRDPIEGRYTLEVSSPGLERSLRYPEHFNRSVGSKVVLKTREPLIPSGHRIEGVIERASDDAAAIDTSDGVVEVPYEQVKTARTVFEW